MATDRTPLSAGTQIEGKHTYTIKRMLGEGGFSLTYEATAPYLDGNIRQTMRYCVKEFYPEGICTREADGSLVALPGHESEFKTLKKHFVTEADLMREVCHHKGVVAINEVFDYKGTSYYIMEYVDGVTLDQWVRQQGALREEDALELIYKLGEALTFLHSKNILHLDVKPDNILLVKDERGKMQPIIIDFGLSRRYNKNGTLAGTMYTTGVSEGYSPTEQKGGIDEFSPQADVYALGATLIYLLTGQHPCASEEMDATWLKLNLPANLSTETEYALVQAMKPCTERCKSVEDFINLLPLASLRAKAATQVDPNLSPRTKSYPKSGNNGSGKSSKKRLWALLALGALAIAAVAIILLLSPKDSEKTQAIEVLSPEAPTADVATLEVETHATGETQEEKPVINENKLADATPSNETVAPIKTAEPEEATRKADAESTAKTDKTATVGEEKAPGTLNLGYATYEGKVRQGKPHGRGKLTFLRNHAIEANDPEGRMAHEGDVVTGMFYDGHLTQGKITRKDGSTEQISIGY